MIRIIIAVCIKKCNILKRAKLLYLLEQSFAKAEDGKRTVAQHVAWDKTAQPLP